VCSVNAGRVCDYGEGCARVVGMILKGSECDVISFPSVGKRGHYMDNDFCWFGKG
jgi:hypothetical protein